MNDNNFGVAIQATSAVSDSPGYVEITIHYRAEADDFPRHPVAKRRGKPSRPRFDIRAARLGDGSLKR